MNEDEVVQNVCIELVFSQQVELLQRVAVGMGLGAEQGEDVLQDVYLEVLQRPPEFQGIEEATRWLIRVTINRCLSEFRRRKRHGQKAREIFQQWAERERAQVGPDQQVARSEQIQAAREGLGQMSELLRAPLVLKYYCGLNSSEIGKVLELKPGTCTQAPLRWANGSGKSVVTQGDKAMTEKMCDKIPEEKLVAFADGELSPGEATEVSEHIIQCDSCRAMVEALQQSIELAKVSWSAEQANWPKWQAPRAPKLHRWPVPRVLAVAASILLVLGVGLVWRMVSEPGEHPLNGKAIAQLEQTVMRAGTAAQMLAVADLLSKQPAARDYARERYRQIITDYSDTEHAVQAKLRLKTL